MSQTPTEPTTTGFPQQPWSSYAGPSQPPRKKHRIRKVILLSLAGFAGFIVLVSVTGALASSSHKTPVAAPSTAVRTSAAPASTSVTAPATTAPATQAPATQAPAAAAPAMTASQQQAVESAQGYLSDGQGFSYEGLLQQLTSSYGEGFSRADAKFAIKYLHPDWDQQAVESAQGYLNDGQGFSRSELLQQLTSSYGEGFTQAQAEYAVNKVMG